MSSVAEVWAALEAVVAARLAAGDAGQSYVASLAAKGLPKVAQKVGEEAVETVIAAVSESDAALVGEVSDLVFHLTILLQHRGLGWADIAQEITRRHGTSGLVEKASRTAD